MAHSSEQADIKFIQQLFYTSQHTDASIGEYPLFRAALAGYMNTDDATAYGKNARRVVHHLIQLHMRRAEEHMSCDVCARHQIMKGAFSLKSILWNWTDKVGFTKRYTYKEFNILFNLSDQRHATHTLNAIERRLQGELDADSALNATVSELVNEKNGRSESSFKRWSSGAHTAIRAHFRERDDMFQEACQAAGLRLTQPAQPIQPAPAVEPAQSSAASVPPLPSQPRREQTTITLQIIHQQPSAPHRHVNLRGFWSAAGLALTLVALIAAVLNPDNTKAHPTFVSLSTANVAGWIISQQQSDNTNQELIVMNALTGDWRVLLPHHADEDAAYDADAAWKQQVAFASPAYAPRQHMLAFIARDSSGSQSLWIAPLIVAANHWPSVDSAKARNAIPHCQGCANPTWSPDASVLVFESPFGLQWLDVHANIVHQLTTSAHDRWPACSHAGNYLAYQQDRKGIVVVASANCLPLPNAPRFTLNGYDDSWRPAWSADDRELAFATSKDGVAHVYMIQVSDLLAERDGYNAIAGYPMGEDNCYDPAWAERSNPPGPALIMSCAADGRRGGQFQLVISDGSQNPAWAALISNFAVKRDQPIWLPDTL